jgi:hypothetical protein
MIRALAGVLLAGLTAGSLLAGAASADPLASVPPSGTLAFDVIRNDKVIGGETLQFQRAGSDLTVTLKTDIAVKVPVIGINAYVFRQSSTEHWKGGALAGLTSTTDDNGTAHKISVGPTALLPASLWNAEITSAKALLNTIDGSKMPVSVRKLGEETVVAQGKNTRATHYAISGGLKRDLWFNGSGQLVHVQLVADDGSQVDYRLR